LNNKNSSSPSSDGQRYPPFSSGWIKAFVKSIMPQRKDLLDSAKLFGLILLGSILLFPLMARLPVLGWDWYRFFNINHPTDNINSPVSPFLPFTKYFIMLLTWMNWRDSLAVLGGITYMSVALGTWRYGGRYGSVLLALTTPLPLIVLWVGHPDGLALLGFLIGFIPLALVKPQITFWGFLRSRALTFWLAVVMGLVFLIWPNWLFSVFSSRWNHSASSGWQALGWPLLLLGGLLLLGAGNDPWRLMAAGCFITPDIMPYHLVVLLPAIGHVRGGYKFLVWIGAWLIFIGVGLGGNFRFLNLLFPLSIYFSLQTPQNYWAVVSSHLAALRSVYHIFHALVIKNK
jgi:hypothetical protein